MILPGRPTGSAYLSPASGLRATAGAFLARSPSDLVSPSFLASHSPRSLGTLGSTVCRSTTHRPRQRQDAGRPALRTQRFSYLVPSLYVKCAGTIEHVFAQGESNAARGSGVSAQRRLQIGVREIVAFVEQRLAGHFGKRISKAIAEIQDRK